jgi:hypothetical protein
MNACLSLGIRTQAVFRTRQGYFNPLVLNADGYPQMDRVTRASGSAVDSGALSKASSTYGEYTGTFTRRGPVRIVSAL